MIMADWVLHCDNCPTDANPDQPDTDHDGVGDACDVYNKPGQTEYQIEATVRIEIPVPPMEKIEIGEREI